METLPNVEPLSTQPDLKQYTGRYLRPALEAPVFGARHNMHARHVCTHGIKSRPHRVPEAIFGRQDQHIDRLTRRPDRELDVYLDWGLGGKTRRSVDGMNRASSSRSN